MTTYNQRNRQFKYPKPLISNSSSINVNRLLSPKRPQPSPSKRQLMMEDLGLEYSDTVSSGSASSSELSNDDSFEAPDMNGPTQAEYDYLQKERDNLLIKHKDLQEQLQSWKGRLHREEMKRKSHVKILKKTQNELLKDKDQLILNLEDIVFDTEQKVHELEDQLKGNPIRPTIEPKPQISSIQKLVDNIKSLHSEKSAMRDQMMELQQDLDEKLSEVIALKERGSQIQDNTLLHRVKSQTDNEKVLEKTKKEIEELKKQLEERENEIFHEKETSESLKQELDDLKKKNKKLDEYKKKTEKKHKIDIEKLNREIEEKNEEIYELENKAPEIVTKTVEKLVEVESSEQKNELSEAQSKIVVLERSLRDVERSLKKSKEETNRVRSELTRCQEQIRESTQESEEAAASHNEEVFRFREDFKQLEAELMKERKNLEKSKKNVNKEKEKSADLEHEVQELKASLRRAKDESMVEVESLKKKMRKQEEELNQEIKEANEAAEAQRIETENQIEKLETKTMKTEEKARQLKERSQQLNEKLDQKSQEVDRLSDALESKEDLCSSLKSKISSLESNLEKEKQKTRELDDKLVAEQETNTTLQNQVKDLCGASDDATVELSNQRKENSNLRIELNHMKAKVEEESENMRKGVRREEKMKEELTALKDQMEKEKSDHQRAIKILQDQYTTSLSDFKTSAKAEKHAVSSKMYKTQCTLRQLLSSLHVLVKENQHLKKECYRFPEMIEEATKQAERKIVDALSEINENSKELVRRYKKEMKLRKKYHNELVELKGNIRVFVRVRPTISEDGHGSDINNVVTYDRDDDSMIYVHNNQRGRSQLFEFDKVFQPQSTQLEVYSEVQPLVVSCIDGYHVCIFAYGQTGSGKTYTMEGPPSDPGINQRALSDLFHEIEDRAGDWVYEVSVSLVEIYNETLKDLLNSSPAADKLEIKMNADGSLYVPRLMKKSVNNLDDVNVLFKLGHANRATACTNMNEHSSRSHAVLIVNVEGRNNTTGVKTFGKLNLIDLAGSERVSKSGASGDRLKEAQNINKSLSALGDVIHALRGKQAHVPFRNSKLTYMLQDSLSKDSKTLMVVQVAPVEKNASESLCSLSFAQRVRTVELGQASKKTEERQEDIAGTPRKAAVKTSIPQRKKF